MLSHANLLTNGKNMCTELWKTTLTNLMECDKIEPLNFSKFIRRFRTEMGLSRKKVCFDTGIDIPKMQCLEEGKFVLAPSVDLIKELESYYEIPENFLLNKCIDQCVQTQFFNRSKRNAILCDV